MNEDSCIIHLHEILRKLKQDIDSYTLKQTDKYVDIINNINRLTKYIRTIENRRKQLNIKWPKDL